MGQVFQIGKAAMRWRRFSINPGNSDVIATRHRLSNGSGPPHVAIATDFQLGGAASVLGPWIANETVTDLPFGLSRFTPHRNFKP